MLKNPQTKVEFNIHTHTLIISHHYYHDLIAFIINSVPATAIVYNMIIFSFSSFVCRFEKIMEKIEVSSVIKSSLHSLFHVIEFYRVSHNGTSYQARAP